MPLTIAAYPDFEAQVRDLVAQHRQLKDQRLRLAVYFAPPARKKRDIFLLEVIEGFGGDEVDPEQKLFEFGYGSTPGLPLPVETTLQMVLTNPRELDEAVSGNWKGVRELRAARKAGRATLIYADPVGRKLWDKLR